jgi:hypothetical protein
MGDWVHITGGRFSIYKKDKVSPEKVFEEIVGDNSIEIEKLDDGDRWQYRINEIALRTDGNTFMKYYPKLLKNLKPIKKSLSFEIEFSLHE